MYNLKGKLFFAGIIFLTILSSAFSQEKISVEEYISTYKDLAIEEMKKYHIPASITLAQGILESECGNSQLAQQANNHFGIKCHKEWTGKTFYQDDDEKDECFRKYQRPEESYKDHSEFLSTRDRYKFLFDIDINDYKGWAYGLKQAGYATNPKYPELLIRIIEENGLHQYDKESGRRSAVGGQRSEEKKQNSEFITSPPEVFEISGRGGNDRVIFLNNGVKFVLAREGDDIYKIADEFEIYSWQVRKYNDLSKNGIMVAGEKIYIEKKRSRSEFDFHVVKEDETPTTISQDYGIRLKSLYRLNDLRPGDELSEGGKLRLKNF
jgi:hypothetical protein